MIGQVLLGQAQVRGDAGKAGLGRQAELVLGVGGLGGVEEVDRAVLQTLVDGQHGKAAPRPAQQGFAGCARLREGGRGCG